METILRELVEEAKDNIDLYQAPRDAIDELYKNPCLVRKCNRNLNVVVVAAPCQGFGDVIFATKFARYLKYGLTPNSQPYSRRVSIVTPAAKMFKDLGVKDVKIVPLRGGRMQCRRLRAYNRPQGLGTLDLIFIAPLMTSFDISYPDVKGLFKESTPFNTLFLSEYQDYLEKGFDITTGIGDEFDGLLFDGAKPSSKLKVLGSTPYALAYLCKDVGIPYCLSNFVKMVTAKYYKQYPNLQIVVPEWGERKLSGNRQLKSYIRKYYPNVYVKTKTSEKQILKSNMAGKLVIRGDILPVPRPDMLSLIKHSIPDILVTGDQSITDVIDCCQRKNIWYQIVPWKRDFAKALAKTLPQSYIASATSSCGTLKAIKWNNKGSSFKKHHDFRKKAKHQLDVAFRAASEARRKTSIVHKYLAQLDKSKSKKLLLQVI